MERKGTEAAGGQPPLGGNEFCHKFKHAESREEKECPHKESPQYFSHTRMAQQSHGTDIVPLLLTEEGQEQESEDNHI